jgi:predicted acetyltransferase
VTISIRLVEGEERLHTARLLTQYAFEPSPRTLDLEADRRFLGIGRRRVHVLFDGGEPRCTASVIEMTENVRGRLLPMGGVAGVASHPAARRNGYARRLLTHVLADMRDQGQVVSALYPFRASFYEKFGYVGIGPERRAILSPRDLAPLLRLDLPGRVALLPYPEAAERVRELTETVQRGTHGMAVRADPGLAGARANDEHWAALATVDGQTAGYLAYRIPEYGGELPVWRFQYRDAAARTLLLSWLARHADQVETVSVPLRPVDRPETWVTDTDLRVESRMSPLHAPAPMVRILSVPALAGMPAGNADVTVRVVDDLIGGVYTLSGGPALTVTPGTHPTAELTGHGLAALTYGVLDPADLPLRNYGTIPPPAAAALRTLFPLNPPFLLEAF